MFVELFRRRKDAFFLERSDSVCAKGHRDLLTVHNEGFLLKIWLEDALCASQRKAHIVAELFAFTGKFTACCHFFTPIKLTIRTIVIDFITPVKA